MKYYIHSTFYFLFLLSILSFANTKTGYAADKAPTKVTSPTKTVTPTKTATPTKTVTPTKTATPTKTVTPTKIAGPTKTVTPTKEPDIGSTDISPTEVPEIPDTFLITFDLNYKTSNSIANVSVAYGKKYGKLPTPKRKGYTFKGWYTKSSGGKRIKASTKLKENNDHTLYAQWTANKYKIKLNATGGKVSKKSYQKTYGKKYGTLPTPTKDGYNFTGWYTKKKEGILIPASSKVKVTKTTTLYAHWEDKFPKIILEDYNMTYQEYNTFPYVQTQSAYQNIKLGKSSDSLARSGCLTCNIALIMTYNGNKTLPTTLAADTSLYTSGGLLIWGSLPDTWSQHYITGDSAYQKLYELLEAGIMPSVCLKNSYGGMHWVTVYGYEGGNKLSPDKFLIFDPGKYSNKTLRDVIWQKGNVSRIIYTNAKQ